VDRVFADRQMIACDFGGSEASLRWRGGNMPKSGQRLVATVAAEAREAKPLQLRRGVVIEDRLMIVETGLAGLRVSHRLAATGFTAPEGLADYCRAVRLTLRRGAADHDHAGLITYAEALIKEAESLAAMTGEAETVIRPGPDAVSAAIAGFPDAEVISDQENHLWQDIDSKIEAALCPSQVITDGALLHISTPPGAAVIDGDSGKANFSPMMLAEAMVTPVAEALMLRRISGPVVIDFPRLDKNGMCTIDAAMKAAVEIDPLYPQCHGFTPGGLYTMTRPWRWQPLHAMMAPTPRRQAIEGVRLARQMTARPASGVVLLPPEAYVWLRGDGAAWAEDVLKALASRIEFRSDEGCKNPVFNSG
jgi:hypothetical protein